MMYLQRLYIINFGPGKAYVGRTNGLGEAGTKSSPEYGDKWECHTRDGSVYRLTT